MTVIDDIKEVGVPATIEPAAAADDVEVLVISVNARTLRFALVRKECSAWRARRELLLDHFSASYAGPHGAEQYGYTLEGLHDAAEPIVSLARRKNVKVLVPADVASDVLNPEGCPRWPSFTPTPP